MSTLSIKRELISMLNAIGMPVPAGFARQHPVAFALQPGRFLYCGLMPSWAPWTAKTTSIPVVKRPCTLSEVIADAI